MSSFTRKENLRIEIFVQIQRVSTCQDEERLLYVQTLSATLNQTKQKQQNIQPNIRKSISQQEFREESL